MNERAAGVSFSMTTMSAPMVIDPSDVGVDGREPEEVVVVARNELRVLGGDERLGERGEVVHVRGRGIAVHRV